MQRRFGAANDCEDIVQEAMIRVIASHDSEKIGNLRAYLFRVAGNLSIDALRRGATRERISGMPIDSPEAMAVASPEPSAEQALIAQQRKAAFEAALATLPDRQRQALTLNRLQGWSHPRIAAHLGCSTGTVYNDIKAAMAAIIAQTSEIEL
ncbi:RNA polymerase sigma factor [Novosphingobium rosa]|uniref:RNA polymerase sigma factor n=1 Tax=Novosphingobium rosa TaxID=76978 RepID=UPI0008347249|nr:RNA polymerase sigma factor [Novosphingobium rosa]